MDKNNGYLICNNCFGYYKLKENESPDDFKGCECGGPLEYRESIDNLRVTISNSSSETDSRNNAPENDYNPYYSSNKEIPDILSSKSKEREKYIENLQETVLNEDVILKYINEEQILDDTHDKLPVSDLIEEKKIEDEFDTQNIMINDIMEKENLFQFYLKNKRENEFLRYNYSYLKIGFIILLIAFLILVVMYSIR